MSDEGKFGEDKQSLGECKRYAKEKVRGDKLEIEEIG
jgi:hypothetical protein